MNYQQTQKRNAIIYSVLGALLVGVSIFAIYQYKQAKDAKLQLSAQYARSFYEMTDFIGNIENDLRKSMLVTSPAQLAQLSGNIYRMSNSAKSCLGQLPVGAIELDNTSKFLSQVGDYTYVLSQNAIYGEKISDDQYKDLMSLTKYATTLSSALQDTRNAVENGDIMLQASNNPFAVHASDDILSSLENVETSFQEYPSLIYDGPFSEHIENVQSHMLELASEITVEQAKKRASEFLKIPVELIIYESDTQNSNMSSYNFYTDAKDRQYVSVTKKGGLISQFIKTREVNEANLSFEQVGIIAGDFLHQNGFYSMEKSYYEITDNIAVMNFAYSQDGIKCYSDLIKVKVALDNGEILGMECKGYIMNHKTRTFPQSQISAEDAKAKLNPHLEYISTNMALIPKDNLEEVLCYEFKGSFEGKNFIIYINTQNGREEKILMLIESPSGILTI